MAGLSICVFCSSSNELAPAYVALATELGELLARHGHELVYGGGNVGLMGQVARAVHAHGGRIYGVIPQALVDYELAYEEADELVVTANLRERKQRMEDRAHAFIALPGGIGTLEEVLEIITLKQLHYHNKAVVLVNAQGYYDPLLAQLDRAVAERFARPELHELYQVASDAATALRLVEEYQPRFVPAKYPEQVLPEAARAALEAEE